MRNPSAAYKERRVIVENIITGKLDAIIKLPVASASPFSSSLLVHGVPVSSSV